MAEVYGEDLAAGRFVRLHGVLHASRANGPGSRSVVWFQGCDLGCRGCFNHQTRPRQGGRRRPVGDLVDELLRQPDISGITISGGEPFQQPEALLEMITRLDVRSELSILLFSGYRLEEIEAMHKGEAILARLDVLIAGRYLPSRRASTALLGSANQHVHLLTERYSLSDLEQSPPGEIVIDRSGRVTITGIGPPALSG